MQYANPMAQTRRLKMELHVDHQGKIAFIPIVDLRICFAGFDSVICSWLLPSEVLRAFRRALIDGTFFGVS